MRTGSTPDAFKLWVMRGAVVRVVLVPIVVRVMYRFGPALCWPVLDCLDLLQSLNRFFHGRPVFGFRC